MFVPKYFEVSDRTVIDQFIRANNFGILVSTIDGAPFATHLPFHYTSDGKLLCHVAKSNQQWKDIEEQKVLVVFPGPHAYVSPTWYEDNGVPTWNYQTVHVYANATSFQDEDRLRSLVMELSSFHETGNEKVWNQEFDSRMLKAIVGIELDIIDVQCKFKLSQNKSEKDQHNVIAELEQQGEGLLANQMRDNTEN